MNNKPNIIHFAGHGDQRGIFLENEGHRSDVVSTKALITQFNQHKKSIELVILNSCYSTEQAIKISELGIYVVGMNAPVGDFAAISFTEGVYLGLGANKNFLEAFEDGKTILLAKHPESAKLPEIWKDGVKLNLDETNT